MVSGGVSGKLDWPGLHEARWSLISSDALTLVLERGGGPPGSTPVRAAYVRNRLWTEEEGA